MLPVRRGTVAVRGLLPSGRSIVIGIVLFGLAAGAYAAALETSVFAVNKLVVVGGSPRVQAEVREALAPELGRSLLRIGGDDLNRRAAAIPDLISLRFDRSFPHTLRIRVSAERAVLLVRRGPDTWVVSARGRVMRRLHDPSRSSLPRVWVPKTSSITVGQTVGRAEGGLAAAALAPIAHGTFPAGVRFVRSSETELTLVTHSGLEVRLGDIGDLRLKVAIARRILRAAATSVTPDSYVDVSVPERPVLGSLNSQVAT